MQFAKSRRMEKCERTGPRQKVFVFIWKRMSCLSLSRKGSSEGQRWCFIPQQRPPIDELNQIIWLTKLLGTKGKVSQLKLFLRLIDWRCWWFTHIPTQNHHSMQTISMIPRRRQIPPEWNFIVMQIQWLSFTFLSPHLGHARDGDHQPKIIAF